MKYIILAISLLSLQACITPMMNYHGDYCNKYTEEERSAFRLLAGNKVAIDCSVYSKL